MERKRRFQTRQQYAEQKAQSTKFNKIDKNLNYLIAIVAVLIVATLAIIIAQDPQPKDEAETPTNNEQIASNEEKPSTNEKDSTTEEQDAQTEEQPAGDNTTELVENKVLPSADPVVKEVQVNDTWQAYPTEQTGEHVSTYEKGHIDYEEKLKAFFSVLDLQQENSIILSVKNNGGPTTSIAVITSMDKTEMYRVSIEWVANEGWKPTQLEILNTVEGAY